jgi:hypothetical protein
MTSKSSILVLCTGRKCATSAMFSMTSRGCVRTSICATWSGVQAGSPTSGSAGTS